MLELCQFQFMISDSDSFSSFSHLNRKEMALRFDPHFTIRLKESQFMIAASRELTQLYPNRKTTFIASKRCSIVIGTASLIRVYATVYRARWEHRESWVRITHSLRFAKKSSSRFVSVSFPHTVCMIHCSPNAAVWDLVCIYERERDIEVCMRDLYSK